MDSLQILPSFLSEKYEDDENCQLNETLWNDIFDRAPHLRWIYTLWNESEEKMLALLKHHPDLPSKCYTFYCVQDHSSPTPSNSYFCTEQIKLSGVCCCCLEAELLIPAVSEGTILQRLLVNLYVGACPHLLLLLSCESMIIDEKFMKRKITWNTSWLDIKSLTVLKEEVSRTDFSRNIPLCLSGGCLLTYAAILNKTITIGYIMTHVKHCDDLCWITKCTHVPFIYFIIEKRYDNILTNLRYIMNERKADFAYMSLSYPYQTSFILWGIVYDAYFYPLIFSRIFCASVFEWILENMTTFASQKLKSFIRLSLLFCFSECKKDLILYLMKKKENILEAEMKDEFCKNSFSNLELNLIQRWNVEERIVEWNDKELLDLFLKCFPDHRHLGLLFEKSVFSGNEEQVSTIIKQHGSTIRNLTQSGHIRPVILAVMGKSVSLLKLLLRNNIIEPASVSLLHTSESVINLSTVKVHVTYRNSVSTWAYLLECHECVSVLQSFGSITNSSILTNPITECIQTFSESLNICNIVKTLASSFGQFVNTPDLSGQTPLQLAIERDQEELVRALLLYGADPFSDAAVLDRNGSFRLLIDILYCNVDCCNNLDIILSVDWHEEDIYLELFMDFILSAIHSISTKDRNYLFNEFLDREEWTNTELMQKIEAKIQNFFRTPKSLMRCCRDSLRKTFRNINIFRLIDMTKVPNNIHRYLLLENEIEKYKTPYYFVSRDNLFRIR